MRIKYPIWIAGKLAKGRIVHAQVFVVDRPVYRRAGAGGTGGYRLTIKVEGDGEVFVDPQKNLYAPNDVVGLIALPKAGYALAAWSGGGLDDKGNGLEQEVVMTGDITVTAKFVSESGAPGFGIVKGFVSDAQDGRVVAGAQISWNGIYTASTGEDGYFYLPIPAGQTADLFVERPDGGRTRVQDVVVKDGAARTFAIPTRPWFNPNWPLDPPTIKLNIEEGEILSGIVDFEVEAVGETEIQALYFYIGGDQRQPREGTWLEANKGTVTIDTSWLPNGETYIRVLAYDSNDLAVLYVIPVTIFNSGHWAPELPKLIPKVTVTANTFAEPVGFYSFPGLPSGEFATVQAVPEDCTLYVQLRWLPAERADGYRVYRSLDAVNYAPVGTVAGYNMLKDEDDTPYFQLTDHSTQLAPGRRTFYKVVPYNTVGDGPDATVEVTPLPPMEVYLVSPANGAVGVSLKPKFTWELRNAHEFPADTEFQYLFELRLLAPAQSLTAVTSELEYELDIELAPACPYQWNIVNSVAARLCSGGASPYTVWRSEAWSWGGLEYPYTDTGSRNGAFIFTTTDEVE